MMQGAAQALVDWYAAAYGPRRARRYLGGCERRGLRVPPVPERRRGAVVIAVAAVLAIALAATGYVGVQAAGQLSTRTEVHHEQR